MLRAESAAAFVSRRLREMSPPAVIPFLAPDVALVPVPRSSLQKRGALWPAFEIAQSPLYRGRSGRGRAAHDHAGLRVTRRKGPAQSSCVTTEPPQRLASKRPNRRPSRTPIPATSAGGGRRAVAVAVVVECVMLRSSGRRNAPMIMSEPSDWPMQSATMSTEYAVSMPKDGPVAPRGPYSYSQRAKPLAASLRSPSPRRARATPSSPGSSPKLAAPARMAQRRRPRS
jgi:hypothetical protein